MLSATIDGLDAATERLAAYPAALLAALQAKAAELAGVLADTVRNDKLSGGVLAARSGALRDSIVANVSLDGAAVVASVGSEGDVKYAAIQEYGGKTAAHEILPAKGQVLAFMAGGALRFARKVEHPGSDIPERSYLRSSLEEMSPEIIAGLGEVVSQSWEDA